MGKSPPDLSRLPLDPHFFRGRAIQALARKRASMVELSEQRSYVHRVPAIDSLGREIISSARNEIERCDRAIREIESQAPAS